jgi:hypothetical protein
MRTALPAVLLVLASGVWLSAADRVRTPFQLVSLWSNEMLAYLTGKRQAACSGSNAHECERLNTGICDDTAQFVVGPLRDAAGARPREMPPRQRDSANPQYLRLRLANAGHGLNLHDYAPSELDALELVFDCSFSGNDACPGGRFQIGAVHQIELSTQKVTGRPT